MDNFVCINETCTSWVHLISAKGRQHYKIVPVLIDRAAHDNHRRKGGRVGMTVDEVHHFLVGSKAARVTAIDLVSRYRKVDSNLRM